MPELGVATLAGVHFALAIPNVSYPCELIGPLMTSSGIIAGDFYHEENKAIVAAASNLPGIGAELLPEIAGKFNS